MIAEGPSQRAGDAPRQGFSPLSCHLDGGSL